MGPIELIFIVTALFGFLIYVFLVYNFNYWKKRGVDGPKPRPLFGNFPSILSQSRHLTYDVDDIYRGYKSKERFVGIFALRSPQLLVLDPKLAQEILVSNFKSFHDNEFGRMVHKDLDPVLSRNPFMLTGSEWKDKRAEVTPALTTLRIKASYPVMQEVCAKMTKYLELETLKPIEGGLNAKELATRFTTEVVANCVYGVEAGAFEDGECKIREMGAKLMSQSLSIQLYFLFVSLFPRMTNICRMRMVTHDTERFFADLMETAIRLRKETKSDRVDFLNYLLQLQEKKNLSTLEMAAHTMTFFLDGFETSSVLISNCLHLLAEHRDIQQKLRDEINAAVASEGGLSYEKLLDLPYLEQCINETLRLRTPLPSNTKLCTENCEIRTSKDKIIQLEKGTVVSIPYYSFHHDSDYYPDPEKFDPERFSPENGGVKKYKDMGVFLPFGDGPRICLGMRFAQCQSKAAIAEIIRNWEIAVDPQTKSEFVIDPKQFLCLPEGGTWLDFRRIVN
ncbi:unnamed protein product [Hermetia illucens]|uniref:Cytochrome P450 n=1 Tax=Hermetia illucens TaxID=343691 RepID=A0A7R8V4Z1_HERIL|nr:probable cytochrome P450 28d1 [Hermetia illucens]XP_037923312.1 probable cytochrome P450 28d1 [Hermetia illucens]CAD7092564.1 unnamed protein product [Hermetia illucens]